MPALGKWADVEEDDEKAESPLAKSNRIVSAPDATGVKTVTEYVERDGVNYKITKKVRERVVTKMVSKNASERAALPKFLGADKDGNPFDNPDQMRAIGEEVKIEPRRPDKKEDEVLAGMEKKSVWTKFRAPGGALGAIGEDKPAEDGPKPVDDGPGPAPGDQPGKYVPPSLRGSGSSLNDLRMQEQRDRDALTLRVTNLSEDVREGDLGELFGQFGRTQRIFLAKNPETKVSKGFAFITYHNKSDAEMAIKRLNGHGYDNLVLRVEWAKPQNRDGEGEKGGGKGEGGGGDGGGKAYGKGSFGGGSFAEQMRQNR